MTRRMLPNDLAEISSALEALRPNSGAGVYRDGEDVVIAWNSDAPIPDAAAILAAIAALPIERAARADRRSATRTRLRQLAQGAVGKDVTDLTQAERFAVVAVVLHKLGVLDDDGEVLPVGEWA